MSFMDNLRFVKNHFGSSLKKLFKETGKLIKDQKEINGVTTIDYREYKWSATSLLCDRIHQISNAKTYVFADSVLCLGGFSENPNEAWKEKTKWYFEKNHLKKLLNRIYGESMEFGWKIFPGFTTFDIFTQIREIMKEQKCDPEQFKGRNIFMSMFNDIVWREQGHEDKCKSNAYEVANYARRFPRGHWSF